MQDSTERIEIQDPVEEQPDDVESIADRLENRDAELLKQSSTRDGMAGLLNDAFNTAWFGMARRNPSSIPAERDGAGFNAQAELVERLIRIHSHAAEFHSEAA